MRAVTINLLPSNLIRGNYLIRMLPSSGEITLAQIAASISESILTGQLAFPKCFSEFFYLKESFRVITEEQSFLNE